jgi:peptidyl-prolyl cis-trans isomerase B (cyclophilin B)
MSLRSLAVLSATLLLVLAGCGDDEDDNTAEDSGGSTGVECEYTESGEPAREADPPSVEAAHDGDVAATIKTSAGDVAVTLDAASAPCTVHSFTSLADQGYFEDTPCHRLTTEGIFVLQCGDPTGTGTGGPGYSFPDELTGDETYGPGTLAMANAGPDTNGSQFFIVYGDSPLDPNYTVFGSVSEEGLAVVDEVAGAGSDSSNGPGDGAPNTAVTIEAVEVG